jgi:hypothetical protein
MRTSGRFVATLIAVVVWAVAGYAVASDPVAYRAPSLGGPDLVALVTASLPD